MMRLIFGLIGLVLLSCSPEGDTHRSEDFDQLVDMHCRARMLKNERFSLAEEMRQNPIVTKNYDSLRQVKAEAGRALSDSIRYLLNDLTANLSLDEKRVFNERIESRIEKMNCD